MDQSNKSGEPNRMARRIAARVLIGLAGGLALGFCVVAYVLWQDRVAQLEDQLASYLEAQQVRAARVSVDRVELDEVGLRSLQIGDDENPAVQADDVRVGFSLADLLAGRVSHVSIGRLMLRGRLDERGLQFEGLEGLLQTGGGDDPAGVGTQGFPFSEIRIDALRLELSTSFGEVAFSTGGTMRARNASLQILPDDGCVGYEVGMQDLGGVLVDPVSGAFCLVGTDKGIVWPMQPQRGEEGVAQLALRAHSSPVHLRSASDVLMMRFDGPEMTIELNGETLTDAAASVSFDSVHLPAGPINMDDVELDVRLPDLFALDGTWALKQAQLLDRASSPRFSPLQVRGDGQVSTDEIKFDLSVADRRERPLGRVRGDHLMGTGEGRARFLSGALAFEPQGLQPQDLLPQLLGVITNAVGQVSAELDFSWRKGQLASGGRARFDAVGFSTAAARSDGVSGTVELASLVPPRTDIAQTLSIAALDAGFLLKDGALSFSIAKDGGVEINAAQWPFAGGTIRLSSGAISPGAPEQRLSLAVDRVDLAEFLKLLRIDGASGTGIVSGTVPVVVRDGDIWIEGAVLRAADKGQLSYRSATSDAVAQGQSALLFQALEDFQYTLLEVSLDGNALDRLNVGLKLAGANPNLYDGYPFAINVTTEASFAELMQSATVGSRALDLVRELDLQHELKTGIEQGVVAE